MKKEIIYTEHYALIVSELTSPPMKGQTFLTKENIIHTQIGYNYGDRVIIAHRPLKDAPVLEGVPLLPEFSEKEDDVEKVAKKEYPSTNTHLDRLDEADGNAYYRSIFKKGYNKAKETYKFTEEDLRECCSLIFNALGVRDDITTDEIIQHIQQPKRPKYFDCEIEYIHDETVPYPKTLGTKPKTITNPQGNIELVGEYSYE